MLGTRQMVVQGFKTSLPPSLTATPANGMELPPAKPPLWLEFRRMMICASLNPESLEIETDASDLRKPLIRVLACVSLCASLASATFRLS
jgi:hypothetical protein